MSASVSRSAGSDDYRRRLSLQITAGRAFQIKTPATLGFLKALRHWLLVGAQGGYVYAKSRTGKTSGTRWVLASLPILLGGSIPYLEIPLRKQVHNSERAFFQFMLQRAGHKLYAKGTAGDKRDRFTRWLLTRARRSRTGTVILVIDEAQLLSDHHFQWLLDVSNEIEAGGYRLFCLLVGQESLRARALDMAQYAEFEPIVARFLICQHELESMRTEMDVMACLEQFDLTMFPRDSGRSFLENFLPMAWADGFRLAMVGPALFAEFLACGSTDEKKQTAEIPMAYLVMAILQLLKLMASKDAKGLAVPQLAVKAAVAETNYPLFMKARQAQRFGGGEFPRDRRSPKT